MFNCVRIQSSSHPLIFERIKRLNELSIGEEIYFLYGNYRCHRSFLARIFSGRVQIPSKMIVSENGHQFIWRIKLRSSATMNAKDTCGTMKRREAHTSRGVSQKQQQIRDVKGDQTNCVEKMR